VADPHHRLIAARTAIKEAKKPKDPKVAEIIAACTKSKTAKPELVCALKKILDPYQRAVMDALCLGRATDEEIHDATEVPLKVIAAYQEYFFDQSVFDDGLERISWVRAQANYINPEELQLLQCVITAGVAYLTWLLTGRGKFSPAQVLRHSMNDAMFRGMAHRGAPVNSDVAKEAHQWIRTAERLAKSLHIIDPEDQQEAEKQLRIALTYDDTTGNEESTGISPDKILH
jgi:hypothetical protein